MSENTFTHKALAELLGVSETTVKSYRRKFPGCIPVSSQGKPIRFSAEAAAVATRIRDCFETGMSIGEVRARLAKEFAWISPGQPKSTARSGAEVSPELSIGVSNMAKSMVAMTQQHKALLARMQGLEGLLEDLGLKGGPEMDEARRKNAAARERDALLDERLNRLDATTRELAGNLFSLTEQLSRFLGQRDSAAASWANGGGAATLAAAARVMEESSAPPSVAGQGQDQTPSPARVLPLRATAGGGQASGSGAASDTAAGPAEPPRLFFGLPLVARTGQGQYVSAGGRGRGRFSVNDLKAMLVYGYTPPNHFALRWENHGQGWLLHLEQASGQLDFQLLLMERQGQKGNNIVEILQIKKNDEDLHPAEICAIIDSLVEPHQR